MVETPVDKIQQATQEEIVVPKRTRRKARTVETIETGPLMQVETRD